MSAEAVEQQEENVPPSSLFPEVNVYRVVIREELQAAPDNNIDNDEESIASSPAKKIESTKQSSSKRKKRRANSTKSPSTAILNDKISLPPSKRLRDEMRARASSEIDSSNNNNR